MPLGLQRYKNFFRNIKPVYRLNGYIHQVEVPRLDYCLGIYRNERLRPDRRPCTFAGYDPRAGIKTE